MDFFLIFWRNRVLKQSNFQAEPCTERWTGLFFCQNIKQPVKHVIGSVGDKIAPWGTTLLSEVDLKLSNSKTGLNGL
jgi:hypothetical protein